MTTKNKKYFIITAVAAAVLVTTCIYAYMPNLAQNMTSTINTARFILFSGSFEVDKGKTVSSGVFRLDTYTGDVWTLSGARDANGNMLNKWVPIQSPSPMKSSVPAEQPQINELSNLR